MGRGKGREGKGPTYKVREREKTERGPREFRPPKSS